MASLAQRMRIAMISFGFIALAACSHNVRVKSQPMGATVYVNKVEIGTTPVEFEESRSHSSSYMIRLEKEGYLPKEFLLTPMAKESFFGCFLLSGNVFNLPDELEFTLYPAPPTRPNEL